MPNSKIDVEAARVADAILEASNMGIAWRIDLRGGAPSDERSLGGLNKHALTEVIKATLSAPSQPSATKVEVPRLTQDEIIALYNKVWKGLHQEGDYRGGDITFANLVESALIEKWSKDAPQPSAADKPVADLSRFSGALYAAMQALESRAATFSHPSYKLELAEHLSELEQLKQICEGGVGNAPEPQKAD